MFPVTDEYRRDFFSTTLTRVPGGFATLAGAEIPKPVTGALRSALGLHDTYTIGIRSRTTEFGCIHIITRTPDAVMPSRVIDAFVRQCVLALSSIRRMHEIADYQVQLQSLLIEREQQAESLAVALSSVIEVVGRTVELRDPYTAGHQRRVALLAEQIARRCNMSESDVEDIRIAALMHDVGKVTLPAEILSKPGRLTGPEYELVKNHALAGYEIVKTAHMREPIAEMIYQHQERCDGSGYPRGLRADELHPGSKVIMVADVVEAMASHRPYRPAIGMPEAIAEIEDGAGTRYDAAVVAACIACSKRASTSTSWRTRRSLGRRSRWPVLEQRPADRAQRKSDDREADQARQCALFHQLEALLDDLRKRQDAGLAELKDADTKEAGREKKQGDRSRGEEQLQVDPGGAVVDGRTQSDGDTQADAPADRGWAPGLGRACSPP